MRGGIESIWHVEGPIDTMVSFWNTGAAAEDDAFELDYGSGTYLVPIHLAPECLDLIGPRGVAKQGCSGS